MSFDRIVTALLTVAALAIAGALVSREVRHDGPVAAASTAQPRLSREAAWTDVLEGGIRIGAPAAPVQLAVFSDFECPYCQRFHAAFRSARAEFGDSVSLVFVYFPLSMHKFARPAARAAECARVQGRFSEYADALFDAQDSLGLKPWSAYASAAKGIDSARLSRCANEPQTDSAVAAGVALGTRLGVQYTPTVLINGWRYAVPPTQPDLVSTIRAIIGGIETARAVELAAKP